MLGSDVPTTRKERCRLKILYRGCSTVIAFQPRLLKTAEQRFAGLNNNGVMDTILEACEMRLRKRIRGMCGEGLWVVQT
jgi:hypothetical protein